MCCNEYFYKLIKERCIGTNEKTIFFSTPTPEVKSSQGQREAMPKLPSNNFPLMLIKDNLSQIQVGEWKPGDRQLQKKERPMSQLTTWMTNIQKYISFCDPTCHLYFGQVTSQRVVVLWCQIKPLEKKVLSTKLESSEL